MSKSIASRQKEQQRRKKSYTRRQKVNPCGYEYGEGLDFSQALHVPQAIEPDAIQYKCWQNVERKVERDGGKVVNGWTLDDSIKGVRRLIAHAVWESPTGERVDITPNPHPEDLFIEDSRAGPAAPMGYTLRERTPEAALTLVKVMDFERKKIESGFYK